MPLSMPSPPSSPSFVAHHSSASPSTAAAGSSSSLGPSTPKSRSRSPRDSRRKSSLCLIQPIHIPVPPGLVSSPLLQATTTFCKFPAPHIPSQEDEEWLGDTVPLSSATQGDNARGVIARRGQSDIIGSKGRGGEGSNSWGDDIFSISHGAERCGRPRTPVRKISTTSPPLVHWRTQHPSGSIRTEGRQH